MPVNRFSFFSLKTQFENVGDALINRELLRLAAKKSSVSVDLSRCPPDFSKNMVTADDVTIVDSTVKLFVGLARKRISGYPCYYFLSPGGYVGERRGKDYLAALVNTCVLRLMKLAGVRICHLGVSYENLGKKHIILLRDRMKLIYAHYVRDRASAEYARSIGLGVDGVMPDLAFGAFEELVQSCEVRACIAFSFRVDQNPDLKNFFLHIIKELDRRLPDHFQFKVISQVRRDSIFLKELTGSVENRSVSFIDVSENIDQCLEAYDDCSHVVSNRLHALLVGTLRSCTPVAFVDAHHNKKIIGVFDELNLRANLVFQDCDDPVAEVMAKLTATEKNVPDCSIEKQRLDAIFGTIFA